MGYSIRLLKESDTIAFKKIRLNSLEVDPLSWHSSLEEEQDMPDSYFLNKVRNSIYPPIFGYYGYFEENELLGYAQLSTNFYNKKRHIANIYDVTVSSVARRKSVGTKLVNYLIERVRTADFIEQVHLKVNSKNIGAINFYKELGFKKEATVKDAVKEKDGSYQDEYEYVLKI